MNILFVLPYPPSLIRARAHNFIRFLAQRGNTISVATVWRGELEAQALADLRATGMEVTAAALSTPQIARNGLTALATGQPLQARYCWQPALARAAAERLQATPAIDVVHTEHLRAAEFGLSLKRAAQRMPKRPVFAWDSVDCISMLFEQSARKSRSVLSRLVTRFELPRTRRYERAAMRLFDGVMVVSPVDRAALETVAGYRPGEGPVRVVPNGVDMDYFTPNFGPREAQTIVFTGKMSYHANATAAIHLADNIMPRVWQAVPEAKVILAGSGPPAGVVALGERLAPRVRVTGHVPDIRPYIQQATVAAAPITYGAGMQYKVVEAMACGTPVVASPRAVLALSIRPGVEALVAETPEDFAAALVRLLTDEGLRRQLSENGYAYVKRNLRLTAVAEQLEGFYGELATSPPNPPP
jgi:glycosyltransferase involved in cell wall biosynthesis